MAHLRYRAAWMMRLQAVGLLVGVCAACGGTAHPAPGSPARIEIRYGSAAIPPPYNYAWTISASVPTRRVTYRLTYLYRSVGQRHDPALDQDLAWTGPLTGSLTARLSALVAVLRPAPPSPQPLAGADAITIELVDDTGAMTSLTPLDRRGWIAVAALIDQQARSVLHRPRRLTFPS